MKFSLTTFFSNKISGFLAITVVIGMMSLSACSSLDTWFKQADSPLPIEVQHSGGGEILSFRAHETSDRLYVAGSARRHKLSNRIGWGLLQMISRLPSTAPIGQSVSQAQGKVGRLRTGMETMTQSTSTSPQRIYLGKSCSRFSALILQPNSLSCLRGIARLKNVFLV